MTDKQKTIRDLTLMLMYLTSWEERDTPGLRAVKKKERERYPLVRRCWKGYDHGLLNKLLEEGLNRQVQVICYGHTHQAKVVYRQGIYLMNPGTVGGCRAREGYGVIHALGGTVNLELK